ncbi:MAG: site-specific integrase [Acutalibacteraceae bacterium]
MPKEIIQFLSYKETVQNRSPLTVAEYANDLRTFFRYMKAKRTNLRAEDIDGWRSTTSTRRSSSASRRRTSMNFCFTSPMTAATTRAPARGSFPRCGRSSNITRTKPAFWIRTRRNTSTRRNSARVNPSI